MAHQLSERRACQSHILLSFALAGSSSRWGFTLVIGFIGESLLTSDLIGSYTEDPGASARDKELYVYTPPTGSP